MRKKFLMILSIYVFVIAIGTSLWAVDTGKPNFSKCQESGCGSMSWATDCIIPCQSGTLICKEVITYSR